MRIYPYATMPAKLGSFLEQIQWVGIPEKASSAWIKSIGFTSPNDASMIRVLQFIGFIDESRAPTDAWLAFRDQPKSRQILAGSVRQGYAALFDLYEDAHARSPEELGAFFRSHSNLGNKATALMAQTFLALCSLSEIGGASSNGSQLPENGSAGLDQGSKSLVAGQHGADQPWPALRIDLQIHISPEAPPEQIDQIFKSMAAYLYNQGAEQLA